mmetsp:Transcript_6188/g.17623  ORF Transcript_6188/g.17623 Transcript_6188/m.17623 type:complete len:238 (+) Transcript_6188:2172-2885(+)
MPQHLNKVAPQDVLPVGPVESEGVKAALELGLHAALHGAVLRVHVRRKAPPGVEGVATLQADDERLLVLARLPALAHPPLQRLQADAALQAGPGPGAGASRRAGAGRGAGAAGRGGPAPREHGDRRRGGQGQAAARGAGAPRRLPDHREAVAGARAAAFQEVAGAAAGGAARAAGAGQARAAGAARPAHRRLQPRARGRQIEDEALGGSPHHSQWRLPCTSPGFPRIALHCLKAACS